MIEATRTGRFLAVPITARSDAIEDGRTLGAMTSSAPLVRFSAAAIVGVFLLSVSASSIAQPATRRAHIDPRSGVEWAWSGSLSAPSEDAPTSIAHAFAATVLPVGVRARALAPVAPAPPAFERATRSCAPPSTRTPAGCSRATT